jgi:hypothetical protein
MSRLSRIGLLVAGALLLSGAAAAAADIVAPAHNWVLPVFTKEGFRSMLARGAEARVVTARQFEVIDLNLTLFRGDASAEVETVILSPAATFLPDEKVAHGEKSVRFIRDEVEASGTRWIYRQAEKKISLDGAVHVTFRAEFQDLLK